MLIFSGVLILTCCNMHVYTCCFGSCICGVGNDAIWESYLLNLRDGKHFLPCSLPEPLVCCTVHEYFTPIWVVALYIQLICGQCTWKWYFQNNNLAPVTITLFLLEEFHFVFQLPPCLMQNKSYLKICFPLFAVSVAWNVFKIKFTTVHYFFSFTSFSAFS